MPLLVDRTAGLVTPGASLRSPSGPGRPAGTLRPGGSRRRRRPHRTAPVARTGHCDSHVTQTLCAARSSFSNIRLCPLTGRSVNLNTRVSIWPAPGGKPSVDIVNPEMPTGRTAPSPARCAGSWRADHARPSDPGQAPSRAGIQDRHHAIAVLPFIHVRVELAQTGLPVVMPLPSAGRPPPPSRPAGLVLQVRCC